MRRGNTGMDTRIVITGMGCISRLGNDLQVTWSAGTAGQSGTGPITLFDAHKHETRFAAEVKRFDPEKSLGRKEARRMDRATQFAVMAAREALWHACLEVTADNRD